MFPCFGANFPVGCTSSPTAYFRPATPWLFLFVCGTIIFPIIGLLLHCGLDYLITTHLYTFTCLSSIAVTVAYFFNSKIYSFKHNNDSNKSHLSISLRNSQSFHVINNLQLWGRSYLSYPALQVTCDTAAADKQVIRLMFMEEMVRHDWVLCEPQLPADWMSFQSWRRFTPNCCSLEKLSVTSDAPCLAGRTYKWQ